MTPVNQTIFDADAGNCLTASIASLLNLPISAVPNFAAEHGDDCERAAEAWLNARGLATLSLGFPDWETFARTTFEGPGHYCLLSGPSSYPNRGHACVGRVTESGSIELAHDPLPGGSDR